MRPYWTSHDGRIVLYHGDCRDVLPILPPVDLVLTDPPYGVKLDTQYAKHQRGVRAGANDYPPIFGDDKPFDPAPLLRFPNIVLWGANYYADKLPSRGQWLIWDKRDSIGYNDQADCELAWTQGTKGTVPRIYRHLWNGMLKDSERTARRVHPTQKPVALMLWCLSFFPDAKTILDPFMGSGTTAVAAMQLGRRCIGIEIEERYCEIAAARLASTTLPMTLGGEA